MIKIESRWKTYHCTIESVPVKNFEVSVYSFVYHHHLTPLFFFFSFSPNSS